MDLDAIEEIKRLKYRYFRTLDLKDWQGFGDCLATDIRARYGTHAMPDPVHFRIFSCATTWRKKYFAFLPHPPMRSGIGCALRSSWTRNQMRFPPK